MIKKDWWDMSFNPVWGCLYNCPYCYARKIARRYAEQIAEKEMKYMDIKPNLWPGFFKHLKDQLSEFKPTWLESNYTRKFPKKPSIIFVNSMSDPAYWEESWYKKIYKKITENTQHTFVVLTKQPEVYRKYYFPHNTILGYTVNTNIQMDNILSYINYYGYNNKTLISIEPIQEIIEKKVLFKLNDLCDWIHVGEESGNRKGRVRATREMIEPFFNLDMPVFMKNNICKVVPPAYFRREFPEGVKS